MTWASEWRAVACSLTWRGTRTSTRNHCLPRPTHDGYFQITGLYALQIASSMHRFRPRLLSSSDFPVQVILPLKFDEITSGQKHAPSATALPRNEGKIEEGNARATSRLDPASRVSNRPSASVHLPPPPALPGLAAPSRVSKASPSPEYKSLARG